VKQVKVELVKEVEGSTLESIYRELSPRSFFQTPLWLNTLAKAYRNFEPLWLVLHDGGVVRAVMPFIKARKFIFKTIWSMPFGTYGGPIAHSVDEERRLIEEFFSISSSPLYLKAQILLFRSELGYEPPGGVIVGEEECHLIDLSDGFEHYWDAVIRKKRRQLYRKAMREGVVTRRLGEDELEEFYAIYRENSVVWGGVHPYPRVLFEELFYKGGDNVLFLGGFVEGKLMAGHLIFFYGDMAQAWQAAVSEEAYRFYMSEVLIVEAVKEACKRGKVFFNLGGSGGSKGIEEFKESMGGERFRFVVLRKGRL